MPAVTGGSTAIAAIEGVGFFRHGAVVGTASLAPFVRTAVAATTTIAVAARLKLRRAVAIRLPSEREPHGRTSVSPLAPRCPGDQFADSGSMLRPVLPLCVVDCH